MRILGQKVSALVAAGVFFAMAVSAQGRIFPDLREKPAKLTKAEIDDFYWALLDSFSQKFNRDIKDERDLANFLLPMLRPKDQVEMRGLLHGLPKMPQLSRLGETITMTWPNHTIQVRLPDPGGKKLYFDDLAWVFDPSA